MKPIRFLSFFLLSCFLLFTSCVEENTFDTTRFVLSFTQSDPYFEVSKDSLDYPSAGGTGEIKLTTNLIWAATPSETWITISPASGTGDATLSIVVTENTSADARTGNIAFTAGDFSVTVLITQEGAGQEGDVIDGHAYVDLGLPSGLWWATNNVGANSPEDYGNYFAWGETEPQSNFYWSTYKHSKNSTPPDPTLTKYNNSSSYGTVDNKIVLDPEDDAAHVNWGGSWRMPTIEEFQEILNNCTWTWTNQGNHNGYNVVSKSNGNSIFLPAAGYRDVTNLNYEGSNGYYWSSSLNTSYPLTALSLEFGSDYHFTYHNVRLYGYFIRPVLQPDLTKPYFKVSKESLDYPATGGTEEIKLTTNLTWAATISEEWITLSSANGTGEATLSIVVAENTSAEARTGNITFTAGEFSVTVSITQEGAEQEENMIDGHAYVDLGLPSGLLWATCNVGANNPEDYGDSFSWGETSSLYTYYHLSIYDWSNYKWGTNTSLTKYNTSSDFGVVDNKTVLDVSDDAARANWGGNWRIPTVEEWTELLNPNYCTWNLDDHDCYEIVSNFNGNRIILPYLPPQLYIYNVPLPDGSAGSREEYRSFPYWSSSLVIDKPSSANCLQLSSSGAEVSHTSRNIDTFVRPVCRRFDGKFSVTPSSLFFNSSGGAESLIISSDQSWTVSKDASWIKLSTTWGNGDRSLTVTVTENTSTDSRTGTITIMVGNETFAVLVDQQAFFLEIDGHAYVDLGLPSGLLWAAMNVDSSSFIDYGDSYSWGETTTKGVYTWSTYKWCNGTYNSLTKYNATSSLGIVDNKMILDLSDDVAHVKWGGSWRMPTYEEWGELCNEKNCKWTPTKEGDVFGNKVTSLINGKSIFLPAAGYCSDAELKSRGISGHYWSSSVEGNWGECAYEVLFGSYYGSRREGSSRSFGYSIRPVLQPNP